MSNKAQEIARRVVVAYARRVGIPADDLVHTDWFELHIAEALLTFSDERVREEREACAMAALAARYGPPSTWGGENPRGWHLDRPCTPIDASMHDNGCQDAFAAIRREATK